MFFFLQKPFVPAHARARLFCFNLSTNISADNCTYEMIEFHFFYFFQKRSQETRRIIILIQQQLLDMVNYYYKCPTINGHIKLLVFKRGNDITSKYEIIKIRVLYSLRLSDSFERNNKCFVLMEAGFKSELSGTCEL